LRRSDASGDDSHGSVSNNCPLRVIGAGLTRMSSVLAPCNRVAAAPALVRIASSARGEPGLHRGMHGFQSYPMLIAPRIIDWLTARLAVEKVS
jgi:hypothetical protein